MIAIMVGGFLKTALEAASFQSLTANAHLAQPMQKIMMNHMQLVALAAGFPLKWPPEVEALFETFGVVGSSADYMFNPACMERPKFMQNDSVFSKGAHAPGTANSLPDSHQSVLVPRQPVQEVHRQQGRGSGRAIQQYDTLAQFDGSQPLR